MRTFAVACLAAALAVGQTAPAAAQFGADPDSVYLQRQKAYEQALQDYKDALAQYQRERAAYDRRYGSGAYDRKHEPPAMPHPAAAAPPKPAPAAARPYVSPSCTRRFGADASVATAIGGALGAPSAQTSRTAGDVVGAVIDGTLGANLASSPTSAERYAPNCDSDGYYYSSDQTFPYREAPVARRGRNGLKDERAYVQENCRLAVAALPAPGGDIVYRYARVCPDRHNRLRFTD